MRTIGAWDLWRHSSTFLILNAWFASMKCWGWKSAPPTQRSTSYCRLCLNLRPFLKVKHCFSGLFSSNIFAFGYLQLIRVAHRFSVVVELLVKSLFLYAVMRIEPTPASHSETIFSVAMARSNITTRQIFLLSLYEMRDEWITACFKTGFQSPWLFPGNFVGTFPVFLCAKSTFLLN